MMVIKEQEYRPIPIMRGTGSRMLLLGGQTPSKASHVGRMNIKSSGNENDFGELTQARANGGGLGGTTRAILGGGNAAFLGYSFSCNRSSKFCY